MLLVGQSAYDRPDVTCRVFKARLEAFLQNLRNGKYFIDGNEERSIYEVKYIFHVIEYQYRGLPHAHIVLALSNIAEDVNGRVQWIDKHISTSMPDEEENPILFQAVKSFVVHKCSKGVNGCLNDDGECKRGYQKTIIVQETFFDLKGFPVYRRADEKDLLVVPYNADILLDWGGHANVEWCGSTYTCVYLYKYLFKGSKKEKFRLKNADDVHERDEINLYLRGRVLCSMDAAWRLLGYQTYPRSDPSVMTVNVKTEDFVTQLQADELLCDLLIYFNRPPGDEFDAMLYTEFCRLFCYKRKYLPVRFRNRPDLQNVDFFTIRIANIPDAVHIFKRRNPAGTITRMNMLYPSIGELFYLRLILLNIPAR